MYPCTGTGKNSKLALQDVFYVHLDSLYCVGIGCDLIKCPNKTTGQQVLCNQVGFFFCNTCLKKKKDVCLFF